jgi:AAA domain-containing protein
MATGPMSMEPEVLSLEQEKLRLIVYGDAKVGKTTFACTFPRPVFIDTDDGLISLAIQGLTPKRWKPTGYKQLEGIYWWMKEHLDEFDTIVIDSVPTTVRLLLDEIHDQGLATGKEVKPVMQWVPEQGEYQAQQRQMARILTDLNRLKKHMVLISGVRERMGKRSLDVSQGLATPLIYFASVIGELVIVTQDDDGKQLPEPRRVLVTAPGTREAGSRFRSLLPVVWDPTFDVIWRKIQAEYAAASAAARTREETA